MLLFLELRGEQTICPHSLRASGGKGKPVVRAPTLQTGRTSITSGQKC